MISLAFSSNAFTGFPLEEAIREIAAPQVAAEAIARLRALMIPHLIPTG